MDGWCSPGRIAKNYTRLRHVIGWRDRDHSSVAVEESQHPHQRAQSPPVNAQWSRTCRRWYPSSSMPSVHLLVPHRDL